MIYIVPFCEEALQPALAGVNTANTNTVSGRLGGMKCFDFAVSLKPVGRREAAPAQAFILGPLNKVICVQKGSMYFTLHQYLKTKGFSHYADSFST